MVSSPYYIKDKVCVSKCGNIYTHGYASRNYMMYLSNVFVHPKNSDFTTTLYFIMCVCMCLPLNVSMERAKKQIC